MKRIIVTGKSGAGKTTVLNKMKTLGYNVMFCDDIVNDLYQKEQIGYLKIISTFGKEFVNDEFVDRKLLSQAIKNNKISIEELNNIIHPMILDKLKKSDFDFLECPILNENSLENSKIVELDVQDDVAIERLHKFRNIAKDQAKLLVGFYKKPTKTYLRIDTNKKIPNETIEEILKIK